MKSPRLLFPASNVLLLVLFLTGCMYGGSVPQPVLIEVQPSTEEDTRSACKDVTGEPVVGCASWDERQCIIWYPRGDMNVRAHELKHCREGHFHP